MRAIIAMLLLIFSITVAPIALHGAWNNFRAFTYADRGHRLLAQNKWPEAALAFSAAYARNPSMVFYLRMAKRAIDRSHPTRNRLYKARLKPVFLIALPVKLPEKPDMLMAIIPASGTPNSLVKSSDGRFWGPTVRLAFAPAPTPPAAIADIAEHAPQTTTADAELAYAALHDKNFDQARSLFARAIAAESNPQWLADSRPLAKWLSIQSGLTFRNGAAALAGTQALLGQGGGWLDTAVRLNGNPEHPLSVVGFVYSAQNQQHFGLNKDSLQAGFGLRWQPTQKITVEAARLVHVGAQSRNDWMLRAGLGFGAWRPENLMQPHWLHWQARTDVAIIGLSKRDIFASTDTRIGMGFRLSDQLSITPYLGSVATLQKDIRTTTLVEAAPGLWLHRSGRLPLDARLEYRHKISGNSAANDGVALTFGVTF
jgi:hypothetical protein